MTGKEAVWIDTRRTASYHGGIGKGYSAWREEDRKLDILNCKCLAYRAGEDNVWVIGGASFDRMIRSSIRRKRRRLA